MTAEQRIAVTGLIVTVFSVVGDAAVHRVGRRGVSASGTAGSWAARHRGAWRPKVARSLGGRTCRARSTPVTTVPCGATAVTRR